MRRSVEKAGFVLITPLRRIPVFNAIWLVDFDWRDKPFGLYSYDCTV